MLRRIGITALITWLVLIGVVMQFELPFTAIATGSYSTHLAYLLTFSGGPIGSALGIAVACYLYTLNESGWKNKVLTFLRAGSGLIILIGSLALLNERITKPLMKAERPSHRYVLDRLQTPQLIDSLYRLNKSERVAWFGIQIRKNPLLFQNIDPEVLEHWIEEGGYSFPSGHSFNAFLLATIFGFGILHNTRKPNLKNLYVLPFLWAFGVGISRIAIGAHSKPDVIAGAFLGVLFGFLLLYLNSTRHLITHKK